MDTIPNPLLQRLAEEGHAAAKALAASSKPGCRLARRHIAEAARHGLDTKPYIFRNGICYGWSGTTWAGRRSGLVPQVEPMFHLS